MVNQPASHRKNSKCRHQCASLYRLQFLTPHAWVVVLEELLVTQRDHRIHPRSAPRRQEPRKCSDNGQKSRCK